MVKKLKCDACGREVETTFLGKIKGTYVGKGRNRKIYCSMCQKKLNK